MTKVLRFFHDQPRRRLSKDLRYLGVGATCAVICNVFLISIVKAGIGYLPATAITLFPAFFIGYGLHATVTFETKPSLHAFLRYCSTILVGYPVSVIILFVLSDILKLPITVAAPIATLLMFLWNYAFTHWAILRSFHGMARR